MAAACMVHVAAADAIKEHGLTDGVTLIIGLSIMSGALPGHSLVTTRTRLHCTDRVALWL